MSAAATIAARRREAETRFAAEGLPHRRIEAWHYTDLRRALPDDLHPPAPFAGAVMRDGGLTDPFAGVEADTLVFANGFYRADISRLPETPAIQIADLSGPLPDWAERALGASRGPEAGPMADLALARQTSGIAIRVSHNFHAERPLHLAFVNRSASGEARHIRILLVLGTDAHLTLLESHAGIPLLPPQAGGDGDRRSPEGGQNGGLTNLAVELHAEANARLTHLKIANDAADDIHVATLLGTLHANATYDAAIVAGQGALARHETQLKLAQRMGHARMTGFAILGGRQHADITAVIDHAVREGRSDLVFKNVLAGRARGVAQGRIIVREGAIGTDSRQQTRALLLSRTAEADAKPELEIHADDVVCSHGAAIGDLDADALFYLRSRGIPLAQARALLTEAFLEEALDRLPAGPGADAMRAFVLARLHALEAAS